MQSVNPIIKTMKNSVKAILIVTIFAFASCQQKADSELSIPFEKYELGNGLDVIG